MDERILLAVDDSKASVKALDYLAAHVADQPCDVRILHVLPPAPTAGEAPAVVTAGGVEAARPFLERAVARLSAGGVDDDRIEHGFLSLHPDVSAVQGLIDAAREHACGTIVVGRNTLPWHRELFHHHVSDDLVKHAKGFTVWVVE